MALCPAFLCIPWLLPHYAQFPSDAEEMFVGGVFWSSYYLLMLFLLIY
jgi:hypothetical protein